MPSAIDLCKPIIFCKFEIHDKQKVMTQDLYQKAILFAGEKHSGQKVRGSEANYLLHLSNVAMEVIFAHCAKSNFDIDFAVQTALLHDTIEDTLTEYEEIKDKFGNKIADAVLALSKDERIETKDEQIKDSLNRINTLQAEAGIVKLADRITNLQAPPEDWTKEKVVNYCAQSKMLSRELHGKNTYLEKRLNNKIAEYEKRI